MIPNFAPVTNTANDYSIPEITTKNTHQVIAEMLLAEQPQKVLDVPCGAGAFTKRLLDKNIEVYAADCENILQFSTDNFSIADMNEKLPFTDETLDAVVCIDGIEHIERPFDFIRECRRIIRSDGTLIVSTPNLSALRSRWRWFLSGFHLGEKTPLDEQNYSPFHHLTLVSFPELRYRLHANGFKITEISTNRIKPISWLYAPFIPISYIFTRLVFQKDQKRKPGTQKQNTEIIRQNFSVPVLFGETLIVKAKRL